MSKQTACQLHPWSAFAQTVDYFYWNLTMKVNHWINQRVIILSATVCSFTTRECNLFEFTASEVCGQTRGGVKLTICENRSFGIVMSLWLFEFLSHDVACTSYLNTLSRLFVPLTKLILRLVLGSHATVSAMQQQNSTTHYIHDDI